MDSRPDLQQNVQRESAAAAPAQELGNVRTIDHGAIVDAVRTIDEAPARGARGRFIAGGVPRALTSGEDSEQLAALLEPTRRAIVERTIAGLGLREDELSEPLARLVGAFAEATTLRESVFARMALTGGPVSNKGKLRALFTAFLALTDRELRLAQAIGLERRAKRLDFIDQIQAARRELAAERGTLAEAE